MARNSWDEDERPHLRPAVAAAAVVLYVLDIAVGLMSHLGLLICYSRVYSRDHIELMKRVKAGPLTTHTSPLTYKHLLQRPKSS